MRLQVFLNEGLDKEKVPSKEAIEDIRKNCSVIVSKYKKGSPFIFRGARSLDDMFIWKVNPMKGDGRVSANSIFNYYTVLFDEILPSWKGWPKRSKSLICITDYGEAKTYGTPYIIFPHNNSKIGICPAEDIWFSFMKIKSLATFSSDLNHIFKTFEIFVDNKPTAANLKKALQEIDKNDINAISSSSILATEYKQSKSKSFLDFLDNLLNPKTNRFIHGGPDIKFFPIREVWIEGISYMMNVNSAREWGIL